MDDATQEHIARLAQEGKQISRIVAEDFPELDYEEVYSAAYRGGQPPAQGLMRMITTRLTRLKTARRSARAELVDEVHDMVRHLYRNHRTNAGKLNTIRKALDK